MLRFDVPSWILVFALVTIVITAVLCILNWSRRRGWGVAGLEFLRFITVAMILFTLCKPEFHTELPQKEDKQIDLLLLADRSESMTTEDFVFDEAVEPVTRAEALDARLGLLGALTRQRETGEEVMMVFRPSPANDAGLSAGDVITRITVAESRDEARDRTLEEFDHRLGTQNGARRLSELLRDNAGELQGRSAEISISTAEGADSRKLTLNSLDAVIEAVLADNDIESKVYLEEFAEPDLNVTSPELQGTDINSAVISRIERYENLAGLLLFSDGDDNLGEPPTEEASRALRDAGIAAHTVTNAGSSRFPPDVELTLDDIPAKGVIDDRLVIQYHVYNHMEMALNTNITLWQTNQFTGNARRLGNANQLSVEGNGKTTGRFFWEAPGEGNYTLMVDVPYTGGELHRTNNYRSFNIEIQRETNNVLVIDTRPRWEYRYLRNALQRDRDVNVSVLLIHPGAGMARGAGTGYIPQFPPLKREQTTEDNPLALSEYDVVFIGDVGLSPGEITPEQATALRNMVEYQSAGIVFMPGPRGRQLSFYNEYKKHNTAEGETIHEIADQYRISPRTLSYANPDVDWDAMEDGTQIDIPHPLADLVPVAYDVKLPTGNWTGMANDDSLDIPEARFTLMPEGRDSPLLLLARRNELVTNEQLWRNILPGFFWHAGVLRNVPGSRVLAVHDSKRNRHGYLPLIVTQPAGNGQALFMGTDSAWRWRKFVGADYHYRYWSQVVRWMGHRRKQAVGSGMRLLFGTERPAMGDTLQIEAAITDWTGVDDNERVEADLVLPNNQTRPIEFERVAAGADSTVASGVYRATVKLEFAGAHTVRAKTLEAPRQVSKTFGVERRLTEVVGRPIDAPLLAQISRDTGGMTMALADLTPMLEKISEKKLQKREFDIDPLWSNWKWGALILFLLALYWTMRKVLGLI